MIPEIDDPIVHKKSTTADQWLTVIDYFASMFDDYDVQRAEHMIARIKHEMFPGEYDARIWRAVEVIVRSTFHRASKLKKESE